MSLDADTKLEMIDPFEGELQAGLAAALPHEMSQSQLERLFARIYRYLNETAEWETDDLIEGAESFFEAAVDASEPPNTRGDPLIEYPATLAVLAVLAASAVTRHEKLEGTPPHRLELFQQLSELYADTLMYQFDAKEELNNRDLAELIYQKDSVHPGRTCTDIVEAFDDLPPGTYVEIPLVAASQKCMVREEDGTLGGGFDSETKEATGALRSQVIDNHVYVPSEDVYRRLKKQANEKGFRRLYEAHNQFISEANLRKFLEQEFQITERIDRFLNAGQRDLVWTNWDPDSRLVRVLRSAVSDCEELDPGEAYPARVLFSALDRYQPTQEWEEAITSDIKSQRSLANRLASLDTDNIEIIETRERKPNLYRVGYSGSHSRQIEFDEPEDLFELPCLTHLDERLQDQSPTRKDLYNLVRMLRWLPGYREEQMARDEFVQKVKALFQRYPWYDEETSDYQIRYELDQRNRDGNPYLPMGCKNPDMERYCIGREECPYSIYGSLPFPDSMYDQLEDQEQSTRR